MNHGLTTRSSRQSPAAFVRWLLRLNANVRSRQNMDAILFSANPSMVTVDDAIRHLSTHDELYWEVGFRIAKDSFSFPMLGFIHISGSQVEYRATISDIVPFSPDHYDNKKLAERVKPKSWLQEWKKNVGVARTHPWKNALVMTEIVPFSYDTCSIYKYDGTLIQKAPQGYARVLPPGHGDRAMAARARGRTPPPTLAEKNLEDIMVHQLDAIEPGLRLEKRQLSTPAGRLDLLCRDAKGNYVVVEFKRMQGTDQVVGQILRYMGWLSETYSASKVRGIVVVGKKDQALTYALMTIPNVQVKEFKVRVE
jgi:hypothetical protein